MKQNGKVEAYVKNELTNSEQKAFEHQMEQDPVLRGEVDFYNDLSKVVNWKGAMQEAQNELSATQKAPATVRRLGTRSLLAYAASLLVLVSCGTFLFSNMTYSNEALAHLNEGKLSLYEDSVNRSKEHQSIQPLQEGNLALKENRYSDALGFFNTIPTTHPSYFSAQLSSAYAAYQLKDYTSAEVKAALVIEQSSDKLIQQKAEWLMVQTKFANQQQDASFTSLIKKIKQDNTHLFQKEANNLENNLNSFWRRFLL